MTNKVEKLHVLCEPDGTITGAVVGTLKDLAEMLNEGCEDDAENTEGSDRRVYTLDVKSVTIGQNVSDVVPNFFRQLSLPL